MGLIVTIFNEALYKPLFNGLVLFYNIVPGRDLGIAIIILTLVIRFLLYPLSKKAIKSQKALAVLQPKIKEIQKKYKEKDKQAKAMIELYKKYKINPMSSCLPILIQLPIFIALYRVFYIGLKPESLDALYGFVARPESIDPMFLNIVNLAQNSIAFAALAGFLMFIQSKMITSQTKSSSMKSLKVGGLDFSSIMGHQMTYIMPIVMVFIFSSLPAALSLYFIVTTLFGIIQQYLTKTEVVKAEQHG